MLKNPVWPRWHIDTMTPLYSIVLCTVHNALLYNTSSGQLCTFYTTYIIHPRVLRYNFKCFLTAMVFVVQMVDWQQ